MHEIRLHYTALQKKKQKKNRQQRNKIKLKKKRNSDETLQN